MMSLLKEILDFNETFVGKGEYKKYLSDKFPDKKMIIISCMDTRLVEFLPKSMNIHNGDRKFLKQQGRLYPTHLEV